MQNIQTSRRNINIIKKLLIVLSSYLYSHTCLAISLNDAMLLVVKKSAELRYTKKQQEIVKSKTATADGVFDPKFTSLFFLFL